MVPAGHALAAAAEIAFADVLDHDFVGLDRASALQRFLADKAARIGRPLRLRVQLRSFDAVCRMVEAGVGLGIVPETTARRTARTTAIAIVALADSWALRELTICIRDLAALPPSARLLVEHLRQGLNSPIAAAAPRCRGRGSRPGRSHRRPCPGNRAQGWFLVATVRRRSAATSARPGSSAFARTALQA